MFSPSPTDYSPSPSPDPSRSPPPTRRVSSSSAAPPNVGTLSANWIFTINNPERQRIPEEWKEKVRFCSWQLEKGENGTEHLQGYVILLRSQRLSFLKKLDSTAHWEIRRGTHEQALAYVNKEETRVAGPFSYGKEPREGQGKRSDLLEVKRKIDEGATELQVADEHFATFLKYYRGLREYKRLKSTPRTTKTQVVVLFGPTGSGKSHSCHTVFPNACWLSKPTAKNQPLWFDNYDNQETVIIDEFYGWIPFDFLLRLLDAYPLMVPTKGGFCNFNAKRVLITSNKTPHEWYNYANFSGGFAPLERRLDIIINKLDRNSYAVLKSLTRSYNDPGHQTFHREFDLTDFIPGIMELEENSDNE